MKRSLFNLFFSDHPEHGTQILAGMWGFKIAQNRSLTNYIYALITDKILAQSFNPVQSNERGEFDQHFLGQYVWPIAVKNSTAHDSYTCARYENSKPFPTRRLNPSCYVANLHLCDESLEPVAALNDSLLFKGSLPACPDQCRSKEHPDWLYC